MHVAILDDYDGTLSRMEVWSHLPAGWQTRFISHTTDPEEISDCEVVVANRERTILDRATLDKLPKLKHLALTGRLSGQADLDALSQRGISVSYTDGSGQAPAEITLALLLALVRDLPRQHSNLKQGGWQSGPGMSLDGKTLGILGLGRVGSRVASFGRLMNMSVLNWGPTEDQGRSAKLGATRVALEELLSRSDIVVVCLRLSKLSRGLIGAQQLELLKDGACLVNAARAEIIEREALYAELSSGRIRGAFDVFHHEPLPSEDPIRRFPNVVLTPHIGYVTSEVYRMFFGQVVENLCAWSECRPYRNALEK